MSKLNWEKANMRDKIRDQGYIDAIEEKQLHDLRKSFNRSRGRRMTKEERTSLNYIITGRRE